MGKTSIEGMNITDTSLVEYNTTTSIKQGNHWNDALARLSTSQPGAMTWSLGTFAATAFPLADGTVIIPVAIDPVFRRIVRYLKRQSERTPSVGSLLRNLVRLKKLYHSTQVANSRQSRHRHLLC